MNKYLKIFIYVLLALAGVFLLVNAVAPKNLNLKVSETMNAPPTLVFNLVNDLKAWESWSPWSKIDTAAVYSYSDNTAGVGARFSWKGNENLGEGSQTIKESVIGEKVSLALEFNGWDGVSMSDWNFEGDKNDTNVTWDFQGSDTPFLFRFFNLIMKGSLVKSYKEGLSSLKEVAEKRAQEKIYKGYKINEVTMPEKHFILNRQEVKIENIQQFYSSNLGALFGKAQGANVELDGMPSGLYYKWEPSKGMTDMAASIPIKTPVSIMGTSSLTIPSGRALQVDYYGEYNKSANAHEAIDEYMKDYGLLNNPPVIEEYVTDPTTVPDPSKWLTKITYYIAQD